MQHFDFAQRMQCKITFGRVLWNARRNRRISQCELCEIISKKYQAINHYELSKIENDRLEIRLIEYDWLIPVLADFFDLEVEWLQEIRSQTEVQTLDLSKAVFPVYFKP